MPTLISILNSGESLEKALVLSRLAYLGQHNFYQDFHETRVFYGENLPKKTLGVPAHGSLGALISYFAHCSLVPYKHRDDLWEDREFILTRLFALGRVTERMRSKLMEDKSRYDRTVQQMPWCYFLDDLAEKLRQRLRSECPNIRIEALDIRNDIEVLHGCLPHYTRIAKLYKLNPDGVISATTFGRRYSDIPCTMYRSTRQSLVISPNVYLFLTAIFQASASNMDPVTFGFRWFRSRPRRSYDAAISYLCSGGFLTEIEPKNQAFGEILDQIDCQYGAIPLDHKINLAIYSCLNRFF